MEQSREGVAPSPTPWCSSYRKGSLRVTLDYGRQLYFTTKNNAEKGNVCSTYYYLFCRFYITFYHKSLEGSSTTMLSYISSVTCDANPPNPRDKSVGIYQCWEKKIVVWRTHSKKLHGETEGWKMIIFNKCKMNEHVCDTLLQCRNVAR